MPTYAYKCADCQHEFDIYQNFSDSALTECPECRGKLRKVFGSLGVTFNGSGFYRTDSRSSSGNSASAGGSGSSGSGSSGSSSASSGAKSGGSGGAPSGKKASSGSSSS